MSFQLVSTSFVAKVPVLDLVMADEKILFLLSMANYLKILNLLI